MAFVRVVGLDELWSGDMVGCRVRGRKVLLVRIEDAVYAYENRCAHLGAELSRGKLDGPVLTCSAHLWQYDATTGQGVNPACAELTRFAAKIEDEAIWVDVEPARRGP